MNILQAEIDEYVNTFVINNNTANSTVTATMNNDNDDATSILNQKAMLSQTMKQKPKDLKSLLSSMIMNVFEKSNTNPFMIHSVLIIGGGARSPIIQKSIKSSLSDLVGDQFVQEKVVVPNGSLMEELVVLGAVLS